jgi:hypothetical protein
VKETNMTNQEQEEMRAIVREELAACGIHPLRQPAPLPTCAEAPQRAVGIVSMVEFEARDAGPPSNPRALLNVSRFLERLKSEGLRLVPEDMPRELSDLVRALLQKSPNHFDAKHLRRADWTAPEPPTAA